MKPYNDLLDSVPSMVSHEEHIEESDTSGSESEIEPDIEEKEPWEEEAERLENDPLPLLPVTQPHSNLNSDPKIIRSRFGRIIKPPKRIDL